MRSHTNTAHGAAIDHTVETNTDQVEGDRV